MFVGAAGVDDKLQAYGALGQHWQPIHKTKGVEPNLTLDLPSCPPAYRATCSTRSIRGLQCRQLLAMIWHASVLQRRACVSERAQVVEPLTRAGSCADHASVSPQLNPIHAFLCSFARSSYAAKSELGGDVALDDLPTSCCLPGEVGTVRPA